MLSSIICLLSSSLAYAVLEGLWHPWCQGVPERLYGDINFPFRLFHTDTGQISLESQIFTDEEVFQENLPFLPAQQNRNLASPHFTSRRFSQLKFTCSMSCVAVNYYCILSCTKNINYWSFCQWIFCCSSYLDSVFKSVELLLEIGWT